MGRIARTGFGEGLRWYRGELWYSDFRTREVRSIRPDGASQLRAYVPYQPSGLGWRPDGTLLVASMLDQQVIAIVGGRRVRVASLASVAVGPLNDMLVDSHGRAYVGCHGFDPPYDFSPLEGSAFVTPIADVNLVMVTPGGEVERVGVPLAMPNGMALAHDGKVLLVAETLKNRVSAFDVDGDGRLTNYRTFAELEQAPDGLCPDGLCIDREGAIWVALLGLEKFVRVAEGGQVLDEIRTPGRVAVACALGGALGTTLFGAVSDTHIDIWGNGEVWGGIETWEVEVPSGCR